MSSNRQDADKRLKRRRVTLEKYGLTDDTFNALFEAQNRRCAICRSDTPATSKRDARFTEVNWAIDHCHKTGKTRGILCTRCNIALGMAQDDVGLLANMVAYLLKH